MKKCVYLILVFIFSLSLCACNQAHEDASSGIPFGDSFSISSVRIDTEITRAKRYLVAALEDSSVQISDHADIVVRVIIDKSMNENDYYYLVESKTAILIRGGCKDSAVDGLAAFVENHLYLDKPCANIGMWRKYTEYTNTVTDDHVPGWFIQNETEQVVADGVTYRERLYMDADEKPYRTFILTADPNKTTLHYGTSQDGYTIYPVVFQDVKEHMQASVASGYDVIAAVNGDYFAIASTFRPVGIAIKNGVLLKEKWPTRPYTASTKDGKFVVAYRAELDMDVSNIQNAIGGFQGLVKDGEVNISNAYASSLTESHPRTIAGLLPDGKLLLVVIDGRDRDWSNGATLEQGAYLMKSLGAVTAINHDGGGSSTMITRYNNEYFVKNDPSDGELRKVYGSIQIVKK